MQLAQEPGFVATIRVVHPRVGIAVCVLPDSSSPAVLWPLLLQLEPESFCTLAELPACLAALAEKRAYCSGLLSVFTQLATALPAVSEHPRTIVPKGFEALTICEVGIVREMVHGFCRRRIAAALFISPRTVDTHKANIARKLGTAATPYGLTKYVFQHKEILISWLQSVANK